MTAQKKIVILAGPNGDAGMRNFLQIYRTRVDYWQWLDNSGTTPRLLDEGTNE
jgi:hypothetical protein